MNISWSSWIMAYSRCSPPPVASTLPWSASSDSEAARVEADSVASTLFADSDTC